MKNILASIVLSGAGASMLVIILARLIPNDKLHAVSIKLGRLLSTVGRSHLGCAFWEKIEDFFEKSFSVFWRGFRQGLNADDKDN